MKKKLVSAVLAAGMCVSLLAGCGSGSGGSTQTGTSGKAERTELKMVMISVGFNLEDADKVEEKINEHIGDKINAAVDIEWLDMGDYANQLNLKLTSGEVIDVLPTFGTMISSLYSQESLSDLSELVQTYGDKVIEAVGEEYLKAGEINGKLYGIPNLQSLANENSFIYRKDIAEKYQLDFSNVHELKDLTPILKQVHEAEPNLQLIVSNNPNESMLREWAWDGLGDEYGVLMDPTNSTTVENLFETAEYKEYVELMHEWYEAGYVQSDASTSSDNLTTLFDSGMAFGTIAKSYPGNIEEKFMSSQYQFEEVELSKAMATTNQVTNIVMTIPSTSENPEKAMEFLNLLYSDAELQNYLCYGIEGQNYRVVDADKGMIDYVEGENMMTCKYVNKFYVGNPLLSYIYTSQPAGIHETLQEYNASAQKSKALGFSYDSTNVANELSAVSNVVAKYRKGLECGSLDPATELPKFIDELKSAGIDKVVAEKQEQLNTWLEK